MPGPGQVAFEVFKVTCHVMFCRPGPPSIDQVGCFLDPARADLGLGRASDGQAESLIGAADGVEGALLLSVDFGACLGGVRHCLALV